MSTAGGGGGASHHEYTPPKQFLSIAYLDISELKGSKRTQCPLGATCYPVFEEEKSDASDEYSVKQKNA